MAFFIVNKKWSQVEDMLLKECPQALNLWWHVAPLTNNFGAISLSQKAFEELMGVKSRTTVNKAINYLHSKHLIMVGRIGNQNTYILDNHFIRQTHGKVTNKKLKSKGIVFPSNTVLLKSENRSGYDEFAKYIKKYKAGKIDLGKFKANKRRGSGRANKNGEKIRHANQYTKPKKQLKIYKTKAEAKRHNGYYQQNILKFDKNKKTS